MSYKLIPVTNAKDFLNFMSSELTDGSDLKNYIIESFEDSLSRILELISKGNVKDDERVNQFKYNNGILYYMDPDTEHKEQLRLMFKKESSVSKKKEVLHRMISFLINDLRMLIYAKGYQFIRNILRITISSAQGSSAEGMPLQLLVFQFGKLYGEKINTLLNKLLSYTDILEGVNGFSFEEWDEERAEIARKFIETELNKETMDNVELYLEKYFEYTIITMERNCAELECKVQKIKIN